MLRKFHSLNIEFVKVRFLVRQRCKWMKICLAREEMPFPAILPLFVTLSVVWQRIFCWSQQRGIQEQPDPSQAPKSLNLIPKRVPGFFGCALAQETKKSLPRSCSFIFLLARATETIFCPLKSVASGQARKKVSCQSDFFLLWGMHGYHWSDAREADFFFLQRKLRKH